MHQKSPWKVWFSGVALFISGIIWFAAMCQDSAHVTSVLSGCNGCTWKDGTAMAVFDAVLCPLCMFAGAIAMAWSRHEGHVKEEQSIARPVYVVAVPAGAGAPSAIGVAKAPTAGQSMFGGAGESV